MPNHVATAGERMSAPERLDFLRKYIDLYNLSYTDVARFTGYSIDSVCGWLSHPESTRHREVPARGVDRLLLELQMGKVKGSK